MCAVKPLFKNGARVIYSVKQHLDTFRAVAGEGFFHRLPKHMLPDEKAARDCEVRKGSRGDTTYGFK